MILIWICKRCITDERLASTKLAINNDLNIVEQRSIKNKIITNIWFKIFSRQNCFW